MVVEQVNISMREKGHSKLVIKHATWILKTLIRHPEA